MEDEESKRKSKEEKTLKSLIWDEFKRCLAFKICLQRYLNSKRKRGRLVNIIISGIAIIGAVCELINHWIPLAILVIVAILNAFRSEIIGLIQPEEELSRLDNLYSFYNLYFVDIEKLWYDFYNKKASEDELSKRFFKLKKSECNNRSLYNKLVRSLNSKDIEFMNNEVKRYTELYSTEKGGKKEMCAKTED